jgi:hypothetical protein
VHRDLVPRPRPDPVDHEVLVGEVERHAIRPRVAAALVVSHDAGETAERTGRRHEAGVMDAPGLDPHDP